MCFGCYVGYVAIWEWRGAGTIHGWTEGLERGSSVNVRSKVRSGLIGGALVPAVAGLVWAGFGSASAHLVPSQLTLQGNGQSDIVTVKGKAPVVCSGRLKTPGHPRCGHGAQVGLWRVGRHHAVDTTTTNGRGSYTFSSRRVRADGTWYSRFNGRFLGKFGGYGPYGYGASPHGCDFATSNRVHVNHVHP